MPHLDGAAPGGGGLRALASSASDNRHEHQHRYVEGLQYSCCRRARNARRYDAFEMTLEVLRMQQQYPGADPAQYVQLDEQFRSFVQCGADDMQEYGRRMRKQYDERQAHAAQTGACGVQVRGASRQGAMRLQPGHGCCSGRQKQYYCVHS